MEWIRFGERRAVVVVVFLIFFAQILFQRRGLPHNWISGRDVVHIIPWSCVSAHCIRHIDEFLDQYTPLELEKLERKDPLKRFSEKIAI